MVITQAWAYAVLWIPACHEDDCLATSPPCPPAHRSQWFQTAIDLACALAAIAPLLLTAHLPLYDLPNHIAMLHVLLARATSPTLQHIYGVHWAFVPNMALQLFAWPLHPLLSVEATVRLFCIVTVLLLCAGTRALNLALGGDRLRVWRAAPLLCWGAPLQFGFVSYCMGVGLMLLALALYIRTRHRAWPFLAALFVPIGAVLLAAHLMAWGFFSISLAGCELAAALSRPPPMRARARWLCGRAVLVAGLSLPALLLLLVAQPQAHNAAPDFTHAAKLSSLVFKAQSLAAITWFAMPALELPLLLAALACLGAALWWRLLRPHPMMAGMAGLLGVAWLILPRDIAASAYVDYRVPWAMSFIVLAGLMAGPAASRPRLRALTAVMVGLAALRVGSIAMRAVQCEPEMAAIDRALAGLPSGASLWVVKGRTPGSLMKTPPVEHMAAYIVLRRDGFDAQAFAGAPGQLVYLQPRYRQMYRMETAAALAMPPEGYDDVLVLNPALAGVPALPALHCVASGTHFMLLGKGSAPAALGC